MNDIIRKWDSLTVQKTEKNTKTRVLASATPNQEKTELVKKRSFATQVDPETIEADLGAMNTDDVIRKQLDKNEGWAGCNKVIDLLWTEKCYKNTRINNRISILRENKEKTKDVPEGRIIEELKARYPDITALLSEDLTNIEYIRKNTETIVSKDRRGEQTTTLYILPLSRSDTDHMEETEKLYKLMKNLKAELKIQESREINIIMTENLDDNYLRKCSEEVFTGIDMQVTVVSSKKNTRKNLPSTTGWKSTGKGWRETTEKVIVKMQGMNYVDALREVRKRIDIRKEGIDIKNIKRTAKGDVLLEIKSGKKKRKL